MSIAWAMSRRDRTILQLGAIAVVILVGASRGVPIYRKWAESREIEAAELSRSLAEARGGVSNLPVLRDSLHARLTRLARIDSSLIAGPTPSAIGAGLVASIEALADSNFMKLGGIQLRVDSVPTAGLVQAEVRVAGITDVAGLSGFLKAVEGGSTMYVVRELAVAQSDPAAGKGSIEALRVDIAIATLGMVRGGNASR